MDAQLYNRQQPGGMFAIINREAFPTGSIWWVGSAVTGATNSVGYGRNPDAPLASIVYAITQAAAGDTVFVLPGHAESVASADALAFSKAGMSVIGLGNANARPTITLTTATTARIAVSAANVTLKNMIVKCDFDEVVTAIHVTAAGCTLDAVDFQELDVAKQLRQFLLTTAAANDLTIQNCRHYALTAAGAAQVWFGLVGTNRLVIRNNILHVTANNSASSHMVQIATTAATQIVIDSNVMTLGGGTTIVSIINIVNSSSGQVSNNRLALTTTTLAASLVLGNGVYGNQNYVVKAADKSGILDPIAE